MRYVDGRGDDPADWASRSREIARRRAISSGGATLGNDSRSRTASSPYSVGVASIGFAMIVSSRLICCSLLLKRGGITSTAFLSDHYFAHKSYVALMFS